MNGPGPAPLMDTGEAARLIGAQAGGGGAHFTGVSIDSRTVAPGDLFVALAGERVDGHEFVERAFARGAAAALVSREDPRWAHLPHVLADDTRRALGRLAAAWRARFDLPVVALTGSNGKTTVKEMVAAILAAHAGGREPVLATRGNLNNDIGLPLTLLGLRAHHRFAVLEMGMNHAGEIEALARLAAPDVALVNNAQRAHIGLLGSVEAIARAKGEIYGGLAAGGTALVNADDPHARQWLALNAGRTVVTFGTAEGADVGGRIGPGAVRLRLGKAAIDVALKVPGEHNARNAIAAAAVAHALGVAPAAIREGLESFAGAEGRLQARRGAGGAVVIDDTYNANPDSLRAAIRVLASTGGRRVLALGDMGELGDAAPQLHAEIGAYARECGVHRLLGLGEQSARAVEAFGEGGRHFATAEALVEAARAEAREGTTILVKGSRFMRMERVAEALAPGSVDAA